MLVGLTFPLISTKEVQAVQRIFSKALPLANVTLRDCNVGGADSEPRSYEGEPLHIIVRFETTARLRISGAAQDTLEHLLSLLDSHLIIFDSLDETHALAPHHIPPGDEDFVRTDVGDLVYQAKSYSTTSGSRTKAESLAGRVRDFVRSHPRYWGADYVTAVPPSNASKAFDLPTLLAEGVSRKLGKTFVPIRKVRPTEAQKNKGSEEECRDNVTGSMSVNSRLAGGSVIIVDDIYRSGSSMAEAARACREAGAFEVLGLAATKTLKFLQGLDVTEYAQRWIMK